MRHITRGMLALVVLGAALPQALAQAPQPGPVDCSAPKAADLATICRTPDLLTMDGELDRAYRAARVRWTASLSNSVRVMHIEWLEKRRACGADADCIMKRIVEQIRELDANRPSDPTWILDQGPRKK